MSHSSVWGPGLGPPPSGLEQELAAQARVDEIFLAARQRGPVADLSYANPYDGPSSNAVEMLAAAAASNRPLSLQYTPYGGRAPARRAAAADLSIVHGIPYDWRGIALTPGAMAALVAIFRSVRQRPGDRVALISPCWQDYPLYLKNLGMEPVLVPLSKPTFELDCDRLAATLRDGPVAAVVLSQPANPTGIMYSKGALTDLARVLEQQDPPPLLISDEAHRSYILESEPFVAPAAVYPHTCTIYSLGKALMMQGQRTGYAAFSLHHPCHAEWAVRIAEACRFMGLCTPTALMQEALPQLIKLRPDLVPLARRRETLIAALHASGADVAPGRHTFFVYVRCGADDLSTVNRLASRGVLALPGSLFHDPGYIRFSLTAENAMVHRAAEIIASEPWD